MNRFSIIEGYYLFCSQHHQGQNCELYERLSRISEYFDPGPMWSESRIFRNVDGEHFETLEVYHSLCVKHGVGMIELGRSDFGTYTIIDIHTGQDILVQLDWDFSGIASTFGWIACECGETDGTIDCHHKTATEMIDSARDYLDDHIGDRAEDPGYFENE